MSFRGVVRGTLLLPQVAVGAVNESVIAVAGHDTTASAVAVPLGRRLSLSLLRGLALGMEVEKPSTIRYGRQFDEPRAPDASGFC